MAGPIYRRGAGRRPRAGLVPLLLVLLTATALGVACGIFFVERAYDDMTSVWLWLGALLTGAVIGVMTLYDGRE